MPNRAIITDSGICPHGLKVETAFPFPLRRADKLVDLCYSNVLREPDGVELADERDAGAAES